MNGGWEVKVSGNTTHYRKKLYDAYGNHVGTIGICKPTKQTGKKKKSALYSFKQVSSQVLSAKTSGKAAQVNSSTEPVWTKDDEKDSKKESVVNQQGVVYEKEAKENGKDDDSKAIYKKSATGRAAIVQQMKAAEEQQRSQLMSIVKKTLQGQVGAYGKATGDNMWQQLVGGNVKVDAATRAQAQKDISEDGYYGVKQTSQRLFDFAAALAGDDVDKMKEMQKAMERGFKQATKTWGRELPAICKETLNAANKLFEDYYSSKEQAG